MTAAQNLLEKKKQDQKFNAWVDRTALEHAISEEIPSDVLAEARVEHHPGGTATLHVPGFLPIRLFLETQSDGIGWQLRFTVLKDGKYLKFCEQSLVDSLVPEDTAGDIKDRP